MNRPRVFVVQNQQRSTRAGAYVPKFNLEPAKVYGDLVFVLAPGLQPFDSEAIVGMLHDKLSDFTKDDYLVLVGNPCIIGWTVAIASFYSGGYLNMLQWDSNNEEYRLIECDLEISSVH